LGGFGRRLDAATLEHIRRSKVAADRPQDSQDVIILREMLGRRDRGAGDVVRDAAD
jgi:hypothetical protein